MAGDWIKVELATIDKPEVVAMADMLGTSRFDVVGRLFKVWGWFDQQSRDGNAGSVTGNVLMRFIDTIAESQGFAATMKKVGWLTDSGMPNFELHNGKSAKNRALTKSRVSKLRGEKCNDYVTHEALPEKRREEVKQGTPPKDGGPVWRDCLPILTSSGLEEAAARGVLGKLLRDYDESEIAAAFVAAAGKADPKSYAMSILKTKPRRGEPGVKRLAI